MQKYAMKTHAVGRFLIDLPETAKDLVMSLRIFGTEIEWKRSTAAQYQTVVTARINRLKGANPATQLFVRDDAGEVPESRIIQFEEDETRDGFIGYEAYHYAEEVGGYFLLTGAASRRKVANVIPSVNEVLKLVHPRLTDHTMTARGIYLDKAFVNGVDPGWGEQVAIMASIGPIRTRFSTHVVESVDKGPLLLRRAESINGFPEAKVLRKSKREIAGLIGAEFAFIDIPQASTAFSLEWRYEGQPNSVVAPQMSASMSSDVEMSIPQDELLGLWDTILDSIRLRPGAI